MVLPLATRNSVRSETMPSVSTGVTASPRAAVPSPDAKPRDASAVTSRQRESPKPRKRKNRFIVFYFCENGVATQVNDDTVIALEGRLIGGCMDILQMYPGTPYDKVKEFNEKYKEDGIIWFLEACDLNVISIRRAIWQLKEAGWFEHLKGFLIGRPLIYGQEMFGVDQYRAVTDLLAEYNVPIIMDLDIGHLAPMMPIMCGGTAKVSVKGNEITIQYTYK